MSSKEDKTLIDSEDIEVQLRKVSTSINELQSKISNDANKLEELKRKQNEIISQVMNKETGKGYENKWFINYENSSNPNYRYTHIFHVKSTSELKYTIHGSFYRECELYQQISITKDKAFNNKTHSRISISIARNFAQIIYPKSISEISEDKVKQIIKEVMELIANDINENLTNKILCNITDAN